MDAEPSILPLRPMAYRLHVPMKWLRDEAAAGRLPHLKAGREMLFHPETVESLLSDRARRSPEAAEAQK